EDHDDRLLALARFAGDLHPALDDDVQRIARIAGVEDDLSLAEPAAGHRARDAGQLVVVDAVEERRAGKGGARQLEPVARRRHEAAALRAPAVTRCSAPACRPSKSWVTVSRVSASRGSLSSRRCAMRGNRSAKPDLWRFERRITSNATSTTTVGSTTRYRPCWLIVCSSNHFVIVAISASVRPL